MKVESSSDVQTVQLLDQPAVIQTSTPVPVNGVDELAHLFNQEVANNSQPLSQRKMSVRVPPIEKMAELYRQLGHPAKKTLAMMSLLAREALRQRADVKDLLELSEGDPARAFVVLTHVAAQADAEVRPSEAALARDAIAKLEVRFKGEIQAGLNIALALQAASVDPQERQALRTLYYASVVTRQSLATMMQALLGVYGGERFGDGLRVMRKALADDIAAKVSSMPTPLLRSLLLGLQSCGQLSGVLAGCHALVERLGIDHDAVNLLQRMLSFAGTGITAAEILRIGDELAGGPDERKLVSLNALYPLVQQLPLALWLDSRVREETLRSFLAVIGEMDRITRGPARFPGELGAMA
ncbi:type III secretion protein W [Pseudomonas cedrina]|uniref:SepL/TyeA/HrpJ family type III secretion system gatekeeper n=2 Tax=Pseudomonas cedrina TaxID=651740 RepID=A0A1V2KBF5_PSECE|nr:type III secretion system gatekeeper subunit SctW [Pseudomonas cedrina]ONH54929.1 SepL/TyeA/HrpJ family type III secretion system gatekeeper [Pseudomonas cedrina subsp. cedrina]SDT65797.1 type III secretion protein W [Pseudomonas cedrina]